MTIHLKMNKFATIIPIDSFQFEKVKYYSVLFEDQDVTEFEDFLNRMEDIQQIEEEVNNILFWIEEIGRKYGAQERFFRHEGAYTDTSALPPPAKEMQLRKIEGQDIRLYCLRANEHVVIFFNGGVKTTQKAQDCPNVAPYFKLANLITQKINQLFQQREIGWNEDFTDIVFDDHLEIEL